MKKILTASIFLTMLLSIAPLTVRADGMIMPPSDRWMYESGQRAVLLYDGKTQSETLVVSVQFHGNAQDFAWILPVPSEPTVSQGSEELFTSLNELIGQSSSTRSYFDSGVVGSKANEQPVTVIRTQTIDYYSVATLKSTDSQALATWLNDNGYQYPTGSEYILNNYVANQWYFVAVKIDLSGISEGQAATELREGNATPLKLVFTARNPVYPMRISSVTGTGATKVIPPSINTNSGTTIMYDEYAPSYYQPSSVNVELYVLASHKQTLPGFTTQYGNWVNNKKIKSWAVDSQGDALLQPTASKYFLTKLTRTMTPAQMTEDLFPRQAANDKKISAGTSVDQSLANIFLFLLATSIFTIIVFIVGIFSPFGIAFIIATLIQVKCRSHSWRVVAWIVQIGVTATYALVGLFVSLVGLASSSSLFDLPREIVGSATSSSSDLNSVWAFTLVIPIGIILAICILMMRWQVSRQRAGRSTIPIAPK